MIGPATVAQSLVAAFGDLAGGGRFGHPEIIDENHELDSGLQVLDGSAAGTIEVAGQGIAVDDNASRQPFEDRVALRRVDEDFVAATIGMLDLPAGEVVGGLRPAARGDAHADLGFAETALVDARGEGPAGFAVVKRAKTGPIEVAGDRVAIVDRARLRRDQDRI